MADKRRKSKDEKINSLSSEYPWLLGLILMGLVLFGYRLGVPGLMDPDEGRYAEIAREILLLRDWLIPHLNLFPYLEKPPLVYWLTAASFKVLGASELAARLPSAAAALGGLLLAYALARTLWGAAPAFMGATVLATCSGYVVLGRLLTLDMTFALLLNLAIGLGYLAMRRERSRLWPWAYGALGLAVLSKGPVALLLAGLIWGLWVWFNPAPPPPSRIKGEGVIARIAARLPALDQWGTWKPLVQPWSWLLLAGLALPWFVYAQWCYPEFFHYFILEHHFGRFLTPAFHPEPVYYYGPVLLGLLLPWSFLLPWACCCRPRDPDRVFLMIWAGVVVVFFSLSRGKLAPYILAALLPLALLLGRALVDMAGGGRDGRKYPGFRASLWGWAAAGAILVSLLYFSNLDQVWSPLNLSRPYLLVVAAVFTLTPILALLDRRRVLLWLGAGALIFSILMPVGMERLSRARSPREMGGLLNSLWQPHAALVGVYLYSQGLSFYSGQVFHLLESPTELDFGRKLAPEQERTLYLGGVSDLAKFVQNRPLIFLYVKERHLEALKTELPGKLRFLARQGDCLLLVYEGK
ncbi:MAG: ArnT family glycosyltransferase [Desulfobaccales bacterium]